MILRDKHGNSVDPQKKHIFDLYKLVQQDIEAGNLMLIWRDFNEDYSDDEKEDMTMLTNIYGLVQLYQEIKVYTDMGCVRRILRTDELA